MTQFVYMVYNRRIVGAAGRYVGMWKLHGRIVEVKTVELEIVGLNLTAKFEIPTAKINDEVMG